MVKELLKNKMIVQFGVVRRDSANGDVISIQCTRENDNVVEVCNEFMSLNDELITKMPSFNEPLSMFIAPAAASKEPIKNVTENEPTK